MNLHACAVRCSCTNHSIALHVTWPCVSTRVCSLEDRTATACNQLRDQSPMHTGCLSTILHVLLAGGGALLVPILIVVLGETERFTWVPAGFWHACAVWASVPHCCIQQCTP